MAFKGLEVLQCTWVLYCIHSRLFCSCLRGLVVHVSLGSDSRVKRLGIRVYGSVEMPTASNS